LLSHSVEVAVAKAKPAPKSKPAVPAPAKRKKKLSAAEVSAEKAQAISWPDAFRTGPVGVAKWNRLTRPARQLLDLSKLNLEGLVLEAINFSSMPKPPKKCASANLTLAQFDSSDLTGADFRETQLHLVSFRKAKLNKACLVGAVLTKAILQNAVVRGADFTDAKLDDAIFTQALFDQTTKWPKDFVIPHDAIFLGKGDDPRLKLSAKKAPDGGLNRLLTKLHATIDPKRMKRTFDMLKKERNQLFAEVEETLVRGVVRSQRDPDGYYSCVCMSDGTYSCQSADLEMCMGLSSEPCKHLLVLIIGLVQAKQLDAGIAEKWLDAANKENPKNNKKTKNAIAETLLKFKGAVAGEIDWRPTETVPEDFYTM
jgi:hypothetical protein